MTTLRPIGIRSSATSARASRAYSGARLAMGRNAIIVRDRTSTAPPADRPDRFFVLRAMRSRASSSGWRSLPADAAPASGAAGRGPRTPERDLDIERPFGMMEDSQEEARVTKHDAERKLKILD